MPLERHGDVHDYSWDEEKDVASTMQGRFRVSVIGRFYARDV